MNNLSISNPEERGRATWGFFFAATLALTSLLSFYNSEPASLDIDKPSNMAGVPLSQESIAVLQSRAYKASWFKLVDTEYVTEYLPTAHLNSGSVLLIGELGLDLKSLDPVEVQIQVGYWLRAVDGSRTKLFVSLHSFNVNCESGRILIPICERVPKHVLRGNGSDASPSLVMARVVSGATAATKQPSSASSHAESSSNCEFIYDGEKWVSKGQLPSGFYVSEMRFGRFNSGIEGSNSISFEAGSNYILGTMAVSQGIGTVCVRARSHDGAWVSNWTVVAPFNASETMPFVISPSLSKDLADKLVDERRMFLEFAYLNPFSSSPFD